VIFSKTAVKNLEETSIELLIEKFLMRQECDQALFEKALVELKVKDHESFEEVLDFFRDSLSLGIILQSSEKLLVFKEQLLNAHKLFFRYYNGPDVPLIRADNCLLKHFLTIPDELGPAPQAAMPLDPSSLWNWGRSPHLFYHAELAVIAFHLARLHSNPDWLKSAFDMANWHLELLDADYEPFVGLYCMEEDYSAEALTYLYASLFATAETFGAGAFISAAALKFRARLKDKRATRKNRGLYLLLLESILPQAEGAQNKIPAFKDLQLKTSYQGSFAAFRAASQSVQLGLQGASSGMGAFHAQNVQVRTFGFQQAPLGELFGFGLDPVSQDIASKAVISFPPLNIKGKCRLAPEGRKSDQLRTFRSSLPSTVWADCEMRFDEKSGLTCQGRLYPLLNLPETLYFSFYVSADSLSQGGGVIAHGGLQKRVLSPDVPFSMVSGSSELQLKLSKGFKEVEVIPLGGEDHFWGAKFLIACRFEPQSEEFSFHLFGNNCTKCDD